MRMLHSAHVEQAFTDLFNWLHDTRIFKHKLRLLNGKKSFNIFISNKPYNSLKKRIKRLLYVLL